MAQLDAPPTASSARTARFTPLQKIAMAVLLTANFTLAVDFSILNVALPHIGRDLGFATDALQWIVTSFALCAAGFTLFFGRVADLFGRRRLFLIGIVLLGVSSLAGGLAQDPAQLIVARVGQGFATAMVTPAALSLMTTMTPEGPARSRALGLNGALMAAGFTAGAVLGGVLTGTVSWRWAFFTNVVVAIAVTLIAPFVLRETRGGVRPRLDIPGAVAITSALVALVFGIDTAGNAGWLHPGAWGTILAAIALFVLFWAIESRVAQPLLAPALLKRRTIAWGNIAGLLAFATETSLVFLLTLYLQETLGFTAVAAGLILGVLGIGTVVGGLIAPRIIVRTSAKAAVVAGFLVQAAATVPLVFVSDSHAWVLPLLIVTFIGGVANLVAIVGYVVTSTSGVPDHQQGLATGLVTMSQQVGIALGTPIMSAIVTVWATADLLPGLRAAIGVNAALALAAGLLVAVVLPRLRGTPDPCAESEAGEHVVPLNQWCP
ncbi:MFS transporter [Occultella kanbiaonis]|uniref:MFS transporter n=1 Tax=Occultella kanbiaonis TaxID=2675754 RepID=UPI0012B813C1|nr:MFS transporter [Occultella kanbiaonis]